MMALSKHRKEYTIIYYKNNIKRGINRRDVTVIHLCIFEDS